MLSAPSLCDEMGWTIFSFDFSHAVQGAFYEWAKLAKGHFYEVSDEEDARRTPAEREPGPLLKKALARVRRASGP